MKRITIPALFFILPFVLNAQDDTIKVSDEYAFSDYEIDIPFYSISKQSTTAPVEIIKGEELKRLPGTNLEEMLTGKITNGEFMNISTRPGDDKTTLRVRGFSYLVLVDGVPRPINEVAPYEVESVNVLKGLTATAMYGPDARDGIIFIQTKRGIAGEKKMNVDVEYGMSAVNEKFLPNWLNAADYAKLYNEASVNDGQEEPFYSDEALNLYQSGEAPLRYPDEDMYNQIFNSSMAFRRVNMNYGGGNDITRYFFNLNYQGEGNGLYKINSLSSDEIGLRSNLDINIGDFLEVNVGAFGKYDILTSPNKEDVIWPVLSSYPSNAFPVIIAPDTFGTNVAYPINPVGDLTNHLQTTQYNLTGRFNINLDFNLSKFIDGLEASAYLSYDINSFAAFAERPDRTYALYEPIFYDDGDNQPDSLRQFGLDDASAGIRQVNDDYYNQFYNYTKISYNKSFGKHTVHTGLVNTFSNFAYKLPNARSQDEKKQNLSYSLFYSFNKKYYLDAVLSYSGIMNLPKDNRFKLFPTVGAGWILSEESFLKNSEAVNFLKLRASYGTMGYFDTNDLFLYRTFWDQGNWVNFNNRAETASERYRGTTREQLGNTSIGWAEQKELNLGIDAVLFNSLTFGMNYFNINQDGNIMNAPIPAVLGTQSYMDNIGITAYSGFDLSVRYTYKKSDNLYFSIGVNGGHYISEVIESNELDYPFPWIGTEGRPSDAIYGLQALGLLTEADIDGETTQLFGSVLPGNIKYDDVNDDGVVQDFIDEEMIGHSRPRYNYGIDLNVKYKNFSLYILGYGLANFDINIRNNPYFYASGNNKYSKYVQENRWTMDNPDVDASHPRLTTGTSSNDDRNSSYWLIDGGFFKIKNVELSYSFSEEAIPNVSMMKIFLRGTNLLTFSDIEDIDPENLGFGISSYPSMRTFSTGLSISF